MIQTASKQQQRAYQFAQKVTAELESRLRDMGVHEGNLAEHDVQRHVWPDGRWSFTLDGRTVLTANPAEYVLQ